MLGRRRAPEKPNARMSFLLQGRVPPRVEPGFGGDVEEGDVRAGVEAPAPERGQGGGSAMAENRQTGDGSRQAQGFKDAAADAAGQARDFADKAGRQARGAAEQLAADARGGAEDFLEHHKE